MQKSEIVIAGCGLSGMITALSFAYYGIKTTIIEKQNINGESFFEDVRTTALTKSSVEFFKEINIHREIFNIAGPINHIYVADNKASEMICFAVEEGADPMGYIVENRLLKRRLLDLVSANKLIKIIDARSYTVKENNEESCILILADLTEIKANLLIPCEGYNSEVKKKYFSSIVNKLYPQYAITFLIKHEIEHEGTALEHFMPSGPFAILPLRDQNISSVVWTIKSEMKDALMKLSKEEFRYLVRKNCGNFLGKVELQSEVRAFELKACLTGRYFNKRIVLVADAAHIIHPLAGQGLNQGIKDIKSLLLNILEYKIDKKALLNYENARKKDNAAMLEITDNINRIFSLNSSFLHQSRQLAFASIEKILPLKNLLLEYAMGYR